MAAAVWIIAKIAISAQWLYENWYADAKWVFHSLQSLKYLNFTNPRWRTAAILKTVTSSYICNLLTGFDKIWHSDA